MFRAVTKATEHGLEGLPKKWVNKQRVLVFSSRGTSFRARHLLKDLQVLMPHGKTDVKLDRKDHLDIVNEVCELRNCNNCIFLEARKKQGITSPSQFPPYVISMACLSNSATL